MLKGKVSIFVLFILLIIILSSIPVPGQQGIFQQIKAYDGEKFKGNLKIESTFPEGISEIKVFFYKNKVETINATSKVTSGKWSFQADVSNWVSGDYEVKFFAHDENDTVVDQITITIRIDSDVPEGTDPGSVFDKSFLDKFKDKSFTDKIKLEITTPETIKKIQIMIQKGDDIKVDQTSDVLENAWKYEKDVKDWETGTYDVTIKAMDDSDVVIDSGNFNIKIKKEEPFYMPLFCVIMLIIFIVLFIVFFILSMLKNKKVMKELRFKPKDVSKKLPMMSLMAMFITLLFVLAGLVVTMTAGLDLIAFLLFLTALGFLMLITYWAFSNRNYPPIIIYLILIILSLVVISMAAVWSESDALGLVVGSGLILTASILFFISILLYWLTSRRGFLIALVTVILALVFFIILIVLVALSSIDFFISWSVSLILGCVLSAVLLLISWLILRDDIFYFEFREESSTHRGWRKTMNMFDIFSTARGLFKRDYDPKVMGKISYEQTHDKKVRMEVISLRDWKTKAGKSQSRRLMGVFVSKMRSKEGPLMDKKPVAEAVNYTVYSSDVNLDDKLSLSKAFGFEVQDSGRERGLDFFDLELIHRPFLGLGTPMGAQKKKKDYDKDSGYARDAEKDKDREREHKYDYEHEEERKKERRERESRAAYERDRDRDRRRERYEEPDEDLEDWDAYGGRGRGREREPPRERSKRREPPPEKPKSRPPPPRIVND